MSRFTTKIDNEYIVGVSVGECGWTDVAEEKQYEANQKLGKLEDLEVELGCPLEIVFKAIYIGIYFYDNYYKDQMMNYIPVLKYNHFECGNKPYIRYLKDYKKTWWLKEDKSE